ncbi:YesL family protein [Microbacterium sp. SS28]|uniref:YesL family protein n=1 Tax=Microbacterium sp. SS28 TaxID=2919948 RepID=UPI001FAA015C|nr:YesL family protein [Microbacterium sp. SS28]
MRIDPESRSLNGLSTFLAFVALNVVYLVTCLPIVTVGAATASLYEVMIRFSDEESGRPLRDYFPAFRANFGRATLVALWLLPPIVVLAFAGIFWWSHPSPVAGAASIVAFAGSVYLLAAFLYGMAQVAYFRNTIRRTVRNALLLPAAEPVRTMGLVAIPVVAVCLSVLFPPFVFLLLTIGFAIGAYASALLFRSVFARHQPE